MDPVNKYASTEQPILEAGQHLLNQKKNEEALELFKLNLEENPHSSRTYFAVGEAHFRIGNKNLAIENFKKSLELDPRNYQVSRSLQDALAK